MRRILTNFTEKQLKQLDELVKKLGYRSRSEALRDALGLLQQATVSRELKQTLEKLQKEDKSERLPTGQIEENILLALQENHGGLSIVEIAKHTGLHRHTVRKYVALLVSKKILLTPTVGTRKVCFLARQRRVSR
jgi:Arc/MetJ-type ribon-helix-helix transcriptional regulator